MHRSLKSHLCEKVFFWCANKLPPSNAFLVGRFCRKLRASLVRGVIERCGEDINVEPHVRFNLALKIGDRSGIGEFSEIYGDVTIGNDVMMEQIVSSTRRITTSLEQIFP